MSYNLSTLNIQQQKAVKAVKGPILIVAGPGSGKTKVLAHKIAYLVQKDIPPKNILAVTFTNKAAEEIKERVVKLSDSVIPTIGTFHAVCLKILRGEINKIGYKNDFTIYDERDQISLIKQIIKDLKINPEQFKPAAVKENISRAKDELISPQIYQERALEYWPKTVAKIYARYQTALKKNNALDFDDLIALTIQLFLSQPAVLQKYRNKWKYILVDEAHDTNLGQYKFINLLGQKYQNICLIADPDQSIYGWRGANFRNILNFEKDYPGAQIIFLEQNYRSTQNILSASHHIIVKNKERKEKNLWTKNPRGSLISIIETENEKEEGEFIINEIWKMSQDENLKLRDFAVLYRANAQSRAIEEAFLMAGLPYKIIGAIKFYDRKEIKDILAYLKLLLNPQDLVNCQRIINAPPRRLAKYTKNQTRIEAAFELKEAADEPAFQNFRRLIQTLRGAGSELPLTEFINLIIQKTNYEKYIRDGKDEGEKRWENIKELFTVAVEYDKIKPPDGWRKFLEEVSLLSSHDEVETQKDLVNLMTLHCAKGLEFPVVFIVGCEEGIFPHAKSLFDASQAEEERRLCYVGITRAKQKVYLTFTEKRRLYGSVMANAPSRFLLDIPKELVDFRTASRNNL